ncbi:MAG: flagellar export protein FliJ [Pseudomonadota bacterium]
MSRVRVKRLAPVQRFAAREADAAGAALAASEQTLHAQRLTLQELVQYRSGYASTSALPGTWQGQHWSDYNEFLTKLDAAIHAQRNVIKQHEEHCATVRAHWQQKHARAESLSQLAQKLTTAADSVDAANQQKRDDEMSAQRRPVMPFGGIG